MLALGRTITRVPLSAGSAVMAAVALTPGWRQGRVTVDGVAMGVRSRRDGAPRGGLRP
jgi:hypothetical protein